MVDVSELQVLLLTVRKIYFLDSLWLGRNF